MQWMDRRATMTQNSLTFEKTAAQPPCRSFRRCIRFPDSISLLRCDTSSFRSPVVVTEGTKAARLNFERQVMGCCVSPSRCDALTEPGDRQILDECYLSCIPGQTSCRWLLPRNRRRTTFSTTIFWPTRATRFGSPAPKLAPILDFPKLRSAFAEYDKLARDARRRTQTWGLLSVFCAVAALLATATEPLWGGTIVVPRMIGTATELVGLIGALVGAGGVWLGPSNGVGSSIA